ncbi:MAG: nicotinate phosphoribosyltransferase, partial [Defluviitaleaceae bacterium]|nr:nicotinate phosphoribosyltransferase [Defluviitaleaceae bacterium]
MVKRDLSLLTDFYQLTMMQGYLRAGVSDRQSVFELFFRANPSGNGFSVFAGIAQFAEYLDSLEFGGDDIDYLRSLGVFDDGFLEYLRGFRFEGSVEAFAEGSVCFPNEPLMVVKAPIAQANFIETALLNIVNHQTLIATKATRVRLAAGDDEVLEFGLRRAQGADAGVLGARAAFIGGVHATSNVLAGLKFGIPVRGTHSHSWVMGFGDELEAFRQYAISFPDKCILLVDTYDTLESGIPNAIKVFDELKAKGKLGSHGIRLDSGDFAYLSKQARKMLDSSGHRAATITASGDLDEDLIQNLKLQGARIDTWGVGTKLITSASAPSLGGVYKLCAIDEGTGVLTPKIKVSENPDKITT